MELKIIKQFGPSVVKVKIPEKILNDLNQYVNQTISDREKSKSKDLGKKLVGDVTQEFNIEPKFAEEIGWIKFLAACVHEWIRIETKIKIKNFTLKNTWVVRQYKNEYNPVHWHSGHISGAGFLKVPDTFGKHVQDKGDKEYFGGTLNLIHGTRQFMSSSKLKIIPEVGDFYIFPHYLMHTVYPCKVAEQ